MAASLLIKWKWVLYINRKITNNALFLETPTYCCINVWIIGSNRFIFVYMFTSYRILLQKKSFPDWIKNKCLYSLNNLVMLYRLYIFRWPPLWSNIYKTLLKWDFWYPKLIYKSSQVLVFPNFLRSLNIGRNFKNSICYNSLIFLDKKCSNLFTTSTKFLI